MSECGGCEQERRGGGAKKNPIFNPSNNNKRITTCQLLTLGESLSRERRIKVVVVAAEVLGRSDGQKGGECAERKENLHWWFRRGVSIK